MRFSLVALLSLVLGALVASAQAPITVTPSPPPGVSQALLTIVGWVYWLAWLAVIAGIIWGALNWARGDSETGKRYILWAVAGAIILIFFNQIINALFPQA